MINSQALALKPDQIFGMPGQWLREFQSSLEPMQNAVTAPRDNANSDAELQSSPEPACMSHSQSGVPSFIGQQCAGIRPARAGSAANSDPAIKADTPA